MRIARRFAVALTALSVSLVATTAFAAGFAGIHNGPGSAPTDGVKVVYDPVDGSVVIDGQGTEITTFEWKADNGLWNFRTDGANPGVVSPPFDVLSESKFFKLDTAGFSSLDVGTILPAGANGGIVNAGTSSINGSKLPSGGLDKVYLEVVPEPSSLALAFMGLMGLLSLRRK